MSGGANDRRINGSCHCGNIRFTLDWPNAPHVIPIRACSCTLCRKHNAAWTSSPMGGFSIKVDDESKLTYYRFGTQTADFYTCKNCGVIPIVTSDIEGALYAVVNAYTFNDVDPSEMAIATTDFEGEDTDTRLGRRQKNWTPEA